MVLGRSLVPIALGLICLALPTGLRGQSIAQMAAPKAVEVFDLPEGFAQQSIATGISGATGMAVASDGRILICEQGGALRLVKDGSLLPEPVLTLTVDSYWERGLISVTLDPDFPRNGYFYVVYVRPRPYPHHCISRFTLVGDSSDPSSEVVLLEGDDQTQLGGSKPAGHQGGGIRFGGGKLYIGLGEQTAGAPSQRLDSLLGKLLRINADGSIPADNPFVNQTRGKYRAIWAYGLRNPFAFAVQPVSGRMLINDVGGSRWEEINEAQRGANYGWPVTEGPTINAKHRTPLVAYGESDKQSISGGVFYNPPRPQFPPRYVGKYLFADYILNWIRAVDPDRPQDVEPFAANLAGPVALDLGLDGSLYVLCRNAWIKDNTFTPNTGTLHRIFHVSAEAGAPQIVRQPSNVTAANGDRVMLTIEASGAATLEYRWLKDGRAIADAHGPQLELPLTSADDGRRVRCIVSNARGTVATREARVWISPLRNALALDAEPKRGLIRAERDGVYTFRLSGEGVANLFVAGDEVVRLTPLPAPRRAEGAIGLKAGWHALRLIVSPTSPQASVDLAWSGPGLELQPLSQDRLRGDLAETKSSSLVTALHLPERAEHFPRLLSETGVFTSLRDLTPAPGIEPYEVNTPLWSDYAAKRRWIALRGDRTIEFREQGEWRFPPGTVFIKHFELPAAGELAARRLETRLLMTTHAGDAFGVTYKWRADGSDADLLDDGQTEDIPLTDGRATQRWSYPSRKDCLVCHTQQAGYVLGVNTRQLNRASSDPHASPAPNQLICLSQRGAFAQPLALDRLADLPKLAALEDPAASLADRVRSYLDANCAQCHRPGGVRGEFDARFETPLEKQKLLGGKLVAADLGIAHAAVVVPGDRGRSMLLARLARRQDVFNMPPLATHLADPQAIELIGRWIDELK